jgi:hypothetical protein
MCVSRHRTQRPTSTASHCQQRCGERGEVHADVFGREVGEVEFIALRMRELFHSLTKYQRPHTLLHQ